MTSQGSSTVLTIVHGHPDFSPGGGEVAAQTLARAYGQLPQVARSVFLASYAGEPDGRIWRYGSQEYLWQERCADYFLMRGERRHNALTKFCEFLHAINPQVAHVHHGLHLGYELLDLIRHELPRCKILLTLHEFLPMCLRNGHMVTATGALCVSPSPLRCHVCYPERTPEELWLRERRMKHFLSIPDLLIAPSNFLAQRYRDWGIPPKRIATQENALRTMSPLSPRLLSSPLGKRNRFAFFGQIHLTKGLQLLLDALLLMQPQERRQLILEIHGAKLEDQKPPYPGEIKSKLRSLTADGCVRFIGAYSQDELPGRMAGIDYVCVPSLWWENSPVVIQEAFALGRPVLAANMGGMAEKVTDGVDGLLVPPRNPLAWADALLRCANDVALWEKLRSGIKPPCSPEAVAHAHWRLLESLPRP